MSQRVEDLQVWQKAIQLSVAVYKLTGTFPKQEMYGLSSSFNGQQYQWQATSLKAEVG